MRARMAWAGPLAALVVGVVLAGCGNSTGTTQRSCTTAYTVGDTVNATLRSSDCRFQDGSYVDYYRFTATGTTSLLFTLTSDSFAPFLLITDSSKVAVAGNGEAATDSSGIRILVGTGRHHAAANSFDPSKFGPYTLASSAVPSAVENCEDVWVARGISTTQSIATTDCGTNSFYADGFLIALAAGESITVDQTSTAFNAFLELVSTSSMTTVASDDDGGGGTNARLTFTAPTSDVFVLFAETFAVNETGAYTLTIQ